MRRSSNSGASAGAITALHVGILDTDDVLPTDFKRFIDEDGGFEGNTKTTENKQFSTKIRGIINYSGGLYKEEWLDKGDPPIFSYHGIDDDVVPIGFGIAGKSLPMYGSQSLKNRADKVGVENLLVEVPNGKHTDIYTNAVFTPYFIDFHKKMFSGLRQIICSR